MSHNFDTQEINKFDGLAHRWWDAQSEFKPLHDINPLRLDWIEQSGLLAGKKMLDVGCGGGILSEGMAARGAKVVGIDLAEKALSVAQLHLKVSALQVEYLHLSAEHLALERPGSFDGITCMEMLEHVPRPAEVVAACAALVKPGGQIFFSTINRNPKAYLMAVIGAEYVLHLLPRGTHDYRKFIKPSELDAFCRQAGLLVEGMAGLHYNPLTRRYGLNQDVSVNYFYRARRPADGP